jgi:predicted GNAT family acetyltransferase
MSIFGKSKASEQRVTNGRFEIEKDGAIAYLEYNWNGQVLELIHTEVPQVMQGSGTASELIKFALDWAIEKKTKVDIICPFVASYVAKHPEYRHLQIK